MEPALNRGRIIAGVCLIAAPLVMLTGDVLRIAAELIHPAYVALKLSFAFFVPAVLALVHLLGRRADRIGLLGGGLAVVGCLAGSGIVTASSIVHSLESASLDAPSMQAIERAMRDGGVAGLVLMYPLPGLAFPAGRR